MINNTKIIVVSFFVLAFILVIGSSTITHYVKQNTTLNSVKGFTAYNYNGFNYYLDYNYTGSSSDYGTGTLTQNYTLPQNYSYYFGFEFSMGSNGNAHANAYYLTNASAKSSYTAPELETYSYSNSDSQIFVYNTLYNNYFQNGYTNWNETRFWLNASATGNSAYSNPIRIDFMVFAFSTQMINVSKLSGFILNTSDYNYSFSVAKGQFFITINGEPSVDNNILECQNYTEAIGSYQICEAVANGNVWIKTGANYLQEPILTQQPQTYNFNSIFSYQSLEGQLPSCVYSYGYKPALTINGNQISVYSAQNITQNLSTNSGFISYNNLNFSLTGMTYISANLLANVNPNLKILNSNSTILDLSSGLEYQNAFYSDLNTSTENKNLTFNFTSNEKLINTFLSIGTIPGVKQTQIQAKNTNSSVRYPIKLNLTIDMPINNYNREVYIKNIILSIYSIGRGIYSNASNKVFDVANFLDIFTIQNKNYTETNTSVNSFTINYSYNNYAYIHNSNSANYGNYIQVYVPITIYYFVNTTKYPYALANFTSGFNFYVNNLTYMYSNGDFSFSTLDSVPLHALFNSSNSEIVNPSNSEIYNETYTNSSFVPYLYFSFTKYGNVPGQFELLVNNIDQSSSAKFEINGKNYTTSGSVLDLNLNSSTIYENNYAYFVFNNVAQKVPFTIETISFNPCLLDQPIVLYKVKDNISASGSIISVSTCYNGLCTVPQNITNSTTITSTNVGFSLKGTKTFFGMSYVSIGALSFILTNQFLYMVFMLFVLLILAKHYKHDKMLPYVVFALFTLVGFGLGLVNDYIFAMFMLVLVVAIANSFKRFLPIGT